MQKKRSHKTRRGKRYAQRMAKRLRLVEKLEDRLMMAADWRNPVNALDVSGDGKLSPIDALHVIQNLNTYGSRVLASPPNNASAPFLDVNGDGRASPIDALLVISALNEGNRSPYMLSESTDATRQGAVRIGLGQESGSRVYTFAVDASFDSSSESTALGDRLEVYLVDPSDRDRTLLDGGESGSPFFVLSSNAATFPDDRVAFDDSIVSVNLTSLADRSEGELLFELHSGDGEAGSRVTVTPLSNDVVQGVLVVGLPNISSTAAVKQKMLAEWMEGTGGFQEIGLIAFDDASGAVGGVQVGHPGYSQAVLDSPSRQMLFNNSHTRGDTSDVSYGSGTWFGLYVIHDELDIALPEDHLRVRELSDVQWEIDWEDVGTVWPGIERVGERGFDDAVLRLTAVVDDTPVQLLPIADQTVDELATLTVPIQVSIDSPNSGLLYSLLDGPDGAAVDANAGVFSFTPTEQQGPGQYVVRVGVRAADGSEDDETFSVTILEVNQAPSLAAIGDQFTTPGTAVVVDVVATDPDLPANNLVYSLGPGARRALRLLPTRGVSAGKLSRQGRLTFPYS